MSHDKYLCMLQLISIRFVHATVDLFWFLSMLQLILFELSMLQTQVVYAQGKGLRPMPKAMSYKSGHISGPQV